MRMGRPSVGSVISDRYQYHIPPENNSAILRGPRKVARFCLLAVILPCFIVSLCLLMRFVVHGTAVYPMAPSDMRILDHKMSTIWCQGEKVTGNSSFTAFLTDGEPEIVRSPDPVILDRNIIVPDDHKEYWGFYFLAGSRFRVHACARHKGGTLLIVKGRQSLEYCTYIGEADSAGNSDEFSASNSVEMSGGSPHNNTLNSKEEMGVLLSKIRHYIRSRPNNYNKLRKNLADWMLIDQNKTKQTSGQDDINESTKNDLKVDDLKGVSFEHGKVIRRRRHIEVRKISESGENGAFEETDEKEGVAAGSTRTHKILKERNNLTSHSIWSQEHEDQHGILQDPTSPNDGSNSESESSWSSSEEAMAKCEGVLASFNLKADETCDMSSESPWDIAENGTDLFYDGFVNVSGYYYFIFGSENEKRDNIIKARFDMDKFIYHLPPPICENVKVCSVNFTFASKEKLVITVPQPPIHLDSVWNEVYVAQSECLPRTSIYLLCVILVPLVILMCSFQ